MKKELYILVDHEFQYKRFERHDKETFDEWTESENHNTFANVFKYYQDENKKTGKHAWYLEECQKDIANALAKLKSAHIKGKNDKEWKAFLDSKPFDMNKLYEDGLGNWLVHLEADEKVIMDIDKMIQKDYDKEYSLRGR